jgi:hypothetical protein
MKRPFLVLKKDCGEAVRWLSEHLTQSGLQVVQTFDLNTARLDHSLCTCPHHGTEQCDCQMVVLLVYDNGSSPASVVAHGHDGQTWFTLVDFPQQGIPYVLEAAIQDALAPHIFALKLQDLANAL